ncbi:MAG: leucine-rich repeat domain-containing protein [Muribaculaceae bacterium]|nr:leucine-rich repeat domain-containing protein [Muribaculaceae bacterium]
MKLTNQPIAMKSGIKQLLMHVAMILSLCAVFSACTSDDDEKYVSPPPLIPEFFRDNYVMLNGVPLLYDKEVVNRLIEYSRQEPSHPVSVTLTKPGTLSTALVGKTADMDALTVIGPVNEEDTKFITDCVMWHYLIMLDLTDAEFKDNTIPEGAFCRFASFEIDGELSHAYMKLPILNLRLPKGIEVIGDEAFRGSQICSLVLPETVRSLGGECFKSNLLTSGNLVIHSGIKDLSDRAFMRLSNESVSISGSGAALDKIEVSGESIDCISSGAFEFLDSRTIEIGEGIKEILYDAFQCNRSVESITLPKTLSMIESGAFVGLISLKAIYCKNPNPPIADYGGIFKHGYGKFDDTPSTVTVYVPKGSAEKYRQAEGWEYFENFVEADGF